MEIATQVHFIPPSLVALLTFAKKYRYELVLYCSAHVAYHMHRMQLQTCEFISLLLSVFS